MRASLVALLSVLAITSAVTAGKWPWQRRISRDVEVHHKLAHQKIKPEMWPEEPISPDLVDKERFKDALGTLCGRMPLERLERYRDVVLGEAKRFEVDPFLLSALMYDRSGCRPRTPDRETKFGVTRLDIEMHAPHIRRREYRYSLKEGNDWKQHTLKIDLYPFNKWKAQKIESNLYFAAAFLKVFSLQCPDLDKAFGGVPHRHSISHWFYGDRVLEAEPEDRVLTSRRQLLAYYNGAVPESAGTFLGVPMVSPLDGIPRLVIDHFGNRRGKKDGRGHRGIDIDGVAGEPVRAVAAGRVTFSGMDLPGQFNSRQISPEEADSVSNSKMGPGGLYIRINHGKNFGTLYMHLQSLLAKSRDVVEAGQIIGTLGRSGTVLSGPHLHIEFRVGVGRVNPAEPLADVLVNNKKQ